MNGGVVELKGSKHPQANELERRIVMSQYLTVVNSAGAVPPQEEGLFSNSWNGKFHLEMHAWHSGHFAPWGRADLLERSMGWYVAQLPSARERARSHGVRGAWWLVVVVFLQAVLGILTLLNQVPIDLALSHQAVAMVVLTIAVINLERLSPRRVTALSEKLSPAVG